MLHPSITVERQRAQRWLTLWKGEMCVAGYPSSAFTRKRDAKAFGEFITRLLGDRLDLPRVNVRTAELTVIQAEIERLRGGQL